MGGSMRILRGCLSRHAGFGSKLGNNHYGRDLKHSALSRGVGLPADCSTTPACPWTVRPHSFDVPHPVCSPCLLCFGNTLKPFKSLLDDPGNAISMSGCFIRATRSWQGSSLLLGCPWTWKPPCTPQSNHAQTYTRYCSSHLIYWSYLNIVFKHRQALQTANW